jgi:hypothetical protein
MSKKRDRKISLHNEVVAKYLDSMEPRLKQIDEGFSQAEKVKDLALKILNVQSLQGDISSIRGQLRSAVDQYAEHRARKIKKPGEKFIRVATGFSFTTYPYTTTYHKSLERNSHEVREQNPRFAEFERTLKAQESRAFKMIDGTIRYCDLNEISRSPWFTDAFNKASFLRQRFEAAAAAKCALADEKPVAANENGAEKSAAKKQSGGYDHLGNL